MCTKEQSQKANDHIDKLKKARHEQQENRDRGRWKRFEKKNIWIPALTTTLMIGLSFVFTNFSGPFQFTFYIQALIIHFIALFIIQKLSWAGSRHLVDEPELSRKKKKKMERNGTWFAKVLSTTSQPLSLTILSKLTIYFGILTIFPYQLFSIYPNMETDTIYLVPILALLLFAAYQIRKLYQLHRSYEKNKQNNTSHIVKTGAIWPAMKVIKIFIFTILFEGWFFAFISNPSPHAIAPVQFVSDFLATPSLLIEAVKGNRTTSVVAPFSHIEKRIEENAKRVELPPNTSLTPEDQGKQRRGSATITVIIVWLCSSIISASIFIINGGGNRCIFAAVLPIAIQQIQKGEQQAKEILMKIDTYANNLREHIINESSFYAIGGFLGFCIFLSGPLVLHGLGKFEQLASSFNEDTVFFAAALLISWLVPLMAAIFKIEDTFGRNFNRAIADLVMKISQHVVYVGYGDLGKRVVERDIRRTYILDKKNNIIELVTPDLLVERVCTSALVIDSSDEDFLYTAEGDLLGVYGVVLVEKVGGMRLADFDENQEPDEFYYGSKDIWQYSEKKPVILPALKGSLAQPYIYARANLERARLLINTAADDKSINSAFKASIKYKTKAIVCVTNSDQLAAYTYRAGERKIALLYPQQTMGTTMGQRLWAATLKITDQRNCKPNRAEPCIYIIGENKARHYMLKTLWQRLPGKQEDKKKWMENHLQIMIAESGESSEQNISFADYLHSRAQRIHHKEFPDGVHKTGKNNVFQIPIRFQTGSRYTENDDIIASIDALDVRHAFTDQLDATFKTRKPDIIIFNPDRWENFQHIIIQTIRALERIASQVSDRGQATFPLLLFSLLRGDQNERQSLGDISRYYNSVINFHGDPLGMDEGYPSHTRWSRVRKRLIRESIIDANADAEDMIAGIQESLFEGLPGVIGRRHDRSTYTEIDACEPAHPGNLANYLARLASITFKKPEQHFIEPEQQQKPFPVISCQYVRGFQSDIRKRGAVVTGYAVLRSAPNMEQAFEQTTEHKKPDKPYSFYSRIFINDGYRSNSFDQNQKDKKPGKAGPEKEEALDYITGRDPKSRLNAKDIEIALRGRSRTKWIGEMACPGMKACPVASYQKYIVASNRDTFNYGENTPPDLRHCANYHCNIETLKEQGPRQEDEQYPAARFMVCSHFEEETPGALAFILNTLLLKVLDKAGPGCKRKSTKGEWVFNAKYLKDSPCHNRNYTINRIFGYWIRCKSEDKTRALLIERLKSTNPIQLIEILPIGNGDHARRWFDYAEILVAFLNSIESTPRYHLIIYLDGREKRTFKPGEKISQSMRETIEATFPTAIIIYRQNDDDRVAKSLPKQTGDYSICGICGLQGRKHSCERYRPWYNESWARWLDDDTKSRLGYPSDHTQS